VVGLGAFQVGVFGVCEFLGEEELVVRMGDVEGDGGRCRGGAAAAIVAVGFVFDHGNGRSRVVERGVLDGHDGHDERDRFNYLYLKEGLCNNWYFL